MPNVLFYFKRLTIKLTILHNASSIQNNLWKVGAKIIVYTLITVIQYFIIISKHFDQLVFPCIHYHENIDILSNKGTNDNQTWCWFLKADSPHYKGGLASRGSTSYWYNPMFSPRTLQCKTKQPAGCHFVRCTKGANDALLTNGKNRSL